MDVEGIGRMRRVLGLVVALLAMGACGDDANKMPSSTAAAGAPAAPDGGMGKEASDPPEVEGLQVCYQVCEAQHTAEVAGDCVRLQLDTCKGLCDGSRNGNCWSQLVALNRCQLTGEFACGFFSAESDADCTAEVAQYNNCVGL